MLAAPAWLRSQRSTHRRAGHPLRPHERAAFADYFPSATLDIVRVARVEELRGWPLERLGRHLGFRGILDSQLVAGIALIDTIVIVLPALHDRKLSTLSLLFHELVHIEQYRLLGERGFLRAYIGGWLEADRTYLDIPLEEQASDLTDRYDAAPGSAFPVGEAVLARFGHLRPRET